MLCPPPIPYFLSERKFIYRNFEIFIHILEQRGSLLLLPFRSHRLPASLPLACTNAPTQICLWLNHTENVFIVFVAVPLRPIAYYGNPIRFLAGFSACGWERSVAPILAPWQVEKLANATNCTRKIRSIIKAIHNVILLWSIQSTLELIYNHYD